MINKNLMAAGGALLLLLFGKKPKTTPTTSLDTPQERGRATPKKDKSPQKKDAPKSKDKTGKPKPLVPSLSQGQLDSKDISQLREMISKLEAEIRRQDAQLTKAVTLDQQWSGAKRSKQIEIESLPGFMTEDGIHKLINGIKENKQILESYRYNFNLKMLASGGKTEEHFALYHKEIGRLAAERGKDLLSLKSVNKNIDDVAEELTELKNNLPELYGANGSTNSQLVTEAEVNIRVAQSELDDLIKMKKQLESRIANVGSAIEKYTKLLTQ